MKKTHTIHIRNEQKENELVIQLFTKWFPLTENEFLEHVLYLILTYCLKNKIATDLFFLIFCLYKSVMKIQVTNSVHCSSMKFLRVWLSMRLEKHDLEASPI